MRSSRAAARGVLMAATCAMALCAGSVRAWAQDAASQAPAERQSLPADKSQPADDTTQVSGVVIFGRAEQEIGHVVAASSGAIAGKDIEDRPLLRTGEILETVPGMIVTQHSGSGKANQYFLRGFNLDHGTDFGLTIDGVPMNFRTHGHGQGYLDVNGLIPEIVSRVDYRKGPYRADLGDFNLVGGGIITTKSEFDAPFIQGEYGAFDWKRVVAGTSFKTMNGDLLLAGEGRTYDGPWGLPEHLRLMNLYGKHTLMTDLGILSTSLSIYDATWRPTEQIPDRAIGALVPDAYGSLDRYLTGRTEREIFSVQLDGEQWSGGLYVQHYNWNMLSNFTFYLDDPVNGDELRQSEKLFTYGGRLQRMGHPTETLQLTVGGEFRYDDISDVALDHTYHGATIGVTTDAAVREGSAALYGEATWTPTQKLSFYAGLRGDTYNFDVRAKGGVAETGTQSAAILTPKLGVSYQIAPGIALYGNFGQGFHSNDSRGVVASSNPAPGLVRGQGEEVGARFERGDLVATAAYWWLESASELIYVGDSGSVEPSGASARQGLELTMFWRPTPALAIDGVYTYSDSHFRDSPGMDHIPGALKNTAEVGFLYSKPRWNFSGRYRYLGEYPLIEDGSQTGGPTTIVNFRAAWTPQGYEVFGELLNAFDSHAKDIEYYYETYLPAIDTSGPVEGRNSRPVEPRMVRVGLKKTF